MTNTVHTIRLSDERLAGVTGALERWGCREGSEIGDAIHALREVRRLRDGIKALQERCCGSDDLCNGCRALLALLHLRTDETNLATGEQE